MNLGESFTFESIEFTLEDLEQNEDGTYKDGEFKYTIKEAAGDEKGVTYDETEYEITLTVSDNGDGTLEVTADKEIEEIEFINVYTQEKGEGEFAAKKVLYGNQKLKAQQFTFELKDKDGKVLQSKKNDANGDIEFDKIEYEEEGEFVYTVSEVNDGQKDIIYDNSVYTITVKVEDGEDGKYKVTSVITKGGQVVEGIVFRNTTTPNTGIHNGAVFFTGAAGASLSGIAILEYLRRRQKNSKK
jgi:pilin isopeptide linkage protein